MTDTLPQLQYGRPTGTRRRVIRIVTWVTIAVAVGYCARRWGPEAWTRTRYLYSQRQCQIYSPPADQVVFDSDPGRVAGLTARIDYTAASGGAVRVPPTEWINYAGTRFAPVHRPVLFLHERQTPSGQRLIVMLSLTDPTSLTMVYNSGFTYAITTSGTWSTAHQLTHHRGQTGLGDRAGPLRIYAGQPDPNDPTHFTVRYEEAGETTILHGYINDHARIEFSRKPVLE